MIRFAIALCLGLGPGIALAADLVAARTLRVGSIVQQGDIRSSGGEVSSAAEALIGLEARRSLYAGLAVRPSDFGPPTLVRRNDVVTMQFSAGGLHISTVGRALAAGGRGDIIEVMNLTSRITVQAAVVSANQVEVR